LLSTFLLFSPFSLLNIVTFLFPFHFPFLLS
jgi:hypothetical protein